MSTRQRLILFTAPLTAAFLHGGRSDRPPYSTQHREYRTNVALLASKRKTSIAAYSYVVTDDGLLAAVFSSELRFQNRNDFSFIKEFCCSHRRHVLHAHNCVA
jgi:hypothetical protein